MPIGHQSSGTTEIHTHPGVREFRKIRSPLEFLVENYEHEMNTNAHRLLDSADRQSK
jgi:hypothetical protein